MPVPRPSKPKRRKEWPRKAVVLAAGYGSRMRPLSNEIPKPLMPLWGTSLLEHSLSLLSSWGVTDVLVNCHHDPGKVLDFATTQSRLPLRVSLSYEPDIRGTGGVLQQASWFLDDEPFWLMNGDIAADLDPAKIRKAFASRNTLAAVWVDAQRGPRTVEVCGGSVRNFRAPNPGGPDTFTFCGLHLLTKEVLNYMKPDGLVSIIDAYETAMKKGKAIVAVNEPSSFWADLGTPQQYLDAHRDVARCFRRKVLGARLYDRSAPKARRELVRRGVEVKGFVAARDATIARGAKIENAVIWRGSKLGGRTRVTNAIVSEDVALNGPADRIVMRADRALSREEQRLWTDCMGHLEGAMAYPLGERGSGRALTRVVSRSKRAIVVRYDERQENALFVGHAKFLRQLNLRVPAVFGSDSDTRVLVLEDLGNQSLLHRVKGGSKKEQLKLYRAVMDELHRLHRKGINLAKVKKLKLMPPFSPSLYRWEHELFRTHFLESQFQLKRGQAASIVRDLARVARKLGRVPDVLVHRDFQSTNVLFVKQRPAMIDFQGMRRGPAVYDLASLLCDPYVDLEASLQDQLLHDYAAMAPTKAEIQSYFWWAAIQRLSQALGAYGRLSSLRDGDFFAAAIPPALRQLRRAVERVEGLPNMKSWLDDVE